MWLWGWTWGSPGAAAGSPAPGAELGALSRQGGSRFRIFGRVWGRRRIRTGQGTQLEPWGTSRLLRPNGVWGAQQSPPCPQVPVGAASTPGCTGRRRDPACGRPPRALPWPRPMLAVPGLVHLPAGQTDAGDSRNVPLGLGQDQALRHGTGGAGLTWLQRKGPIRGPHGAAPPPSPPPSSRQAGGEIRSRIWGTPCT